MTFCSIAKIFKCNYQKEIPPINWVFIQIPKTSKTIYQREGNCKSDHGDIFKDDKMAI